MRAAFLILGYCAAVTLAWQAAAVPTGAQTIRLAAGPAAGAHSQPQQGTDTVEDKADDKELSPEQTMAKRYPQPVRTGFLVGLPVLDYDDSTIGYIRQVVRTGDGKIQLIVPYRPWFGWSRLEWGARPVAVPIETVVILARQLDAIDFVRDDFDKAPTWTPAEGTQIPADETIKIAIGRR
jgi:hypothetical protein